MNLYYDRFNRITAEDWSPCKLNQASYSPPNSATGDGFEVLYRYDRPDSGQTSDFGVSESNLVGRLVSVQDRGAHTRWAYDARGRVTGIATRLARPVDAAGSWPQDPVHDRYTDDWIRSSIGYDADDRPVRASTGASASELMDPNGISELTLRYTARGTLNHLAGSYGDLLIGASFDPTGRIRLSTLGDLAATTAAFGYDLVGHPQTLTISRAVPQLWSTGGVGYVPPTSAEPPTTQKVLEDLLYNVDAPSGKIASITDNRQPALWPDGAKPASRIFSYDPLGRLTRLELHISGGIGFRNRRAV